MKISEKSFEELDKPIILEELYNNLKNMKCERVPGIDGIPVELIGMIGEDLLYRFIFNNKKKNHDAMFWVWMEMSDQNGERYISHY